MVACHLAAFREKMPLLLQLHLDSAELRRLPAAVIGREELHKRVLDAGGLLDEIIESIGLQQHKRAHRYRTHRDVRPPVGHQRPFTKEVGVRQQSNQTALRREGAHVTAVTSGATDVIGRHRRHRRRRF